MSILNGKAVVVTGAGRGLGRAYALHAALCGAAVVVNDIDGDAAESVVAEIRAAGGTALPSKHSVARADEATALVEQCVRELGRLDGLVNNAGVLHAASVWEEEPEQLRTIVEVNVLGVLYCGAAAARVMREARSGAIVNVTSGAMEGVERLGAYSATKGAVASVTFAWALELAPAGIRVNGISPHAQTRMNPGRRAGQSPAAPERIAPLVSYLLSDLSRGVTGQVVRLAGPELSLVRHPRRSDVVLRSDDWTVEAIAHAFDTELRRDLEPVGFNEDAYRWSDAGSSRNQ